VFSASKDYHEVMRMRLKSQLTSGSHQKIFKIDIFKDALFSEIFIDLLTAANENK